MPQGSPEWLQLRAGIPTASEFDQILKLNFELRDGEMYRTFLYRKLAEWLTGPLPHYGGRMTDQGQFLEPEAIPFFEMETNLDVRKVGFVLADGERCGCSPDGLIGSDAGLEIKSPGPVNHLRYLIEGGLPNAYAAQVHGCLYVTKRKEWHFMSYHRSLPPLHVVVPRDEKVMAKIDASLAKFYEDFDKALKKIEP